MAVEGYGANALGGVGVGFAPACGAVDGAAGVGLIVRGLEADFVWVGSGELDGGFGFRRRGRSGFGCVGEGAEELDGRGCGLTLPLEDGAVSGWGDA